MGVALRAIARVADGRLVARNDGSGGGGVLPVVEHHRGRGGGATGQASVAAKLAQVVIGCLLVPVARQQRAIGARHRGLGATAAGVGQQVGLHVRVFLQIHNLVLVLA